MRIEQVIRNPPASSHALFHEFRPSEKLPESSIAVNGQKTQIYLRDYQTDCIARVAHSYASGNRAPILVLATGAGKALCFAEIARRASLKGTRTLVLAHRVELIRHLRGYKLGWVYFMLRQQEERRAAVRSARSAA